MDKRFLLILFAGLTATSAFSFFGLFDSSNPCEGITETKRVPGATCRDYHLCVTGGYYNYTCPTAYPNFDACNQKCVNDSSVCDGGCVTVSTTTVGTLPPDVTTPTTPPEETTAGETTPEETTAEETTPEETTAGETTAEETTADPNTTGETTASVETAPTATVPEVTTPEVTTTTVFTPPTPPIGP